MISLKSKALYLAALMATCTAAGIASAQTNAAEPVPVIIVSGSADA